MLGLGLGFGLFVPSRKTPDSKWPRWTLLSLGVAAVLVFGLGVFGLIDYPLAAVPAVAIPFAGMVLGVGRIVLGDRAWQSLLGLGLSAVPALFWILFAIGELVLGH